MTQFFARRGERWANGIDVWHFSSDRVVRGGDGCTVLSQNREFVGLSSCIRDQRSLALMGKKWTASSFTKVHGEHVPKHTP